MRTVPPSTAKDQGQRPSQSASRRVRILAGRTTPLSLQSEQQVQVEAAVEAAACPEQGQWLQLCSEPRYRRLCSNKTHHHHQLDQT